MPSRGIAVGCLPHMPSFALKLTHAGKKKLGTSDQSGGSLLVVRQPGIDNFENFSGTHQVEQLRQS
jgi:hypothetical protein